MDIRVGDKITGKWLDNNQIVTEVINSMETLDLLISNIRNKNIEILKIERPVYEEVEEDNELLTEKEKEYLNLDELINKLYLNLKDVCEFKADYCSVAIEDVDGIIEYLKQFRDIIKKL